MGWLQRIFGTKKPDNAKVNVGKAVKTESGEDVPPERVGLNGEYDQSGLAKRVTLAFDEDPDLDDINTLWVAQTGSTVVLKGKVPSQTILNQMVKVAKSVDGATQVNTDQVEVEA